MPESLHMWILYGEIVAVTAAVTYLLTVVLQPLLRNYALARPNARTSHKTPTPQGGGIVVIASTVAIAAFVGLTLPGFDADAYRLAAVFAMTAGLAMVGTTDDIRPLEALPRLLLQTIAVIVVIAALPAGLRVLPVLPWWFERALLVIGSVWFVNLVNFMDGIDWMTVVEVVPVTAGLVAIGAIGGLPDDGMIIALALCGAVIGFAPFNRPIARLFLGDVGSLPIGLLIAWLLILVAGRGHLAAAVLLPLYYVADTTMTLLRRLMNGEAVTQAHRSHFYQRAMDGGFSVYQIVGRVFILNLVLLALAIATVLDASRIFHIIAVAGGCTLVGGLLWNFDHTRR